MSSQASNSRSPCLVHIRNNGKSLSKGRRGGKASDSLSSSMSMEIRSSMQSSGFSREHCHDFGQGKA